MTGSKGRVRQWLNPAALICVALAAVMGWAASFVGLHAYATGAMTGYDFWSGWLVPGTFDGAAFGCTLITYRASINGRPALRGRVFMWGFTAVSAWINWIHQTSPQAQAVAAGLPVAAVAVFDVVLLELRADHEAEHGHHTFRLRPGLLLLRWIADRTGTTSALREQITNIPVAQIAGLDTGTETHTKPENTQTEQPTTADTPAPSADTRPAPKPHPPELSASAGEARTAGTGPKLPAPMLAQLRSVRDAARNEGREFTTADVQAVIKLPHDMAAGVASDLTAEHSAAA